ncbi:hypothetical protein KM043_012180 [Ampulex compressa]|nr:hypothetical protein KM043_012180 [Ampulex compressa]
MRRKGLLCYLWTVLFLGVAVLVAGEAEPAIHRGPDFAHLQQSRESLDARPRLSASQQVQILSDVQQHQQRYRRPQQESNSRNTTPYPSLAKYKVDRTKQQQLQQVLRQQQQVQQLIQQQQQKITQQLNPQFFPNEERYQAQIAKPAQQYQQQYNDRYQKTAINFQNLQEDISRPLFSDQQTLQLQEYIEKQRELESLQKQRKQLLQEQQEIRRQQELLRVQKLQQLTSSTTPRATTVTASVQRSIAVNGTTSTPILLSFPTARKITPSEADLFLKAIASHQKKFSTTTSTTTVKPTTTTGRTLVTVPRREEVETSSISENLLSLIQDQQSRLGQEGKAGPRIKVIYQNEGPSTEVSEVAEVTTRGRSAVSTSSSLEKDALLRQLKLALAQSGNEDDIRNISTRDIVLPNGKKVQVIRAPNDLSSIAPTEGNFEIRTSTSRASPSTTTVRPPKAILEELTKGVLPPGADFEVIRQKSDGKLEEIGKAPIQSLPDKKVTFVVLEEQPDGSYKVQGVKGNGDKESGSDVESIVERIKKGELKLPPSSSHPTTLPTLHETRLGTEAGSFSTGESTALSAEFTSATTFRPTSPRSPSFSTRYTDSKSTLDYAPFVTISPNSVPTTDKYVTSASSISDHVFNSIGSSTKSGSPDREGHSTTKHATSSRGHFIPTMAPVSEIVSTTTSPIPTTFSHHSTYSHVHFASRQPPETSTLAKTAFSTSKTATASESGNVAHQTTLERTTPWPAESASTKNSPVQENLVSLLRREGLFAMAKYLRQSGLDNVLNDTGPYTIFVPTDKAFRTLLVQLGGPEKAEDKFRENPRLLSGLLLHHVIPGAFRIDSLQDEMTGVSLAGTQLRVNEYAMHDHEWNDVKVTTINGAKVAPNKRNIEIPQGIAHAIDRVMFPLPVGDLVQTMQADRERRFITFLRMLHVSGLEETLSGLKTFTVFAPTDTAFASATSKDGGPIWTEEDGAEAAKTIISRHIVPNTLYTAGMRYYLQKDTLNLQTPIHIHKNGGRVRVNEAHVATQNVPATNGVLHAIDGIL